MPRAAQVALAYIECIAKGESVTWGTQLAPLTNELDVRAAAASPEQLQALAQAADALVARFDAARAAWTARSSTGAWALARQHARLLVQSLEVLCLGPVPADSAPPQSIRSPARATLGRRRPHRRWHCLLR